MTEESKQVERVQKACMFLPPAKSVELIQRLERKLDQLEKAKLCTDEHSEDRVQDLVWKLEEFVSMVELFAEVEEDLAREANESSNNKT